VQGDRTRIAPVMMQGLPDRLSRWPNSSALVLTTAPSPVRLRKPLSISRAADSADNRRDKPVTKR
jgi:hypothetical protein